MNSYNTIDYNVLYRVHVFGKELGIDYITIKQATLGVLLRIVA
jgi:hypothetical protein